MFECVRICSVSDTLRRQPGPATIPIYPGAACLVSSADRCSVSSVRACVAVCGLLWSVCLASGTACAAVCAVQSFRVRWGLGSPPEGYTASAGGGVGHARDKIFQRKRRSISLPTPSFLCKTPHPHCRFQKFPAKTKKTPTKGLCSVLYLPYKP